MEKIYYAGIGSRSITDSMYSICFRVTTVLAHEGWVLRSG